MSSGDLLHEGVRKVSVTRCFTGKKVGDEDEVIVEEPLEMRIIRPTAVGQERKTLSVTMRTPGHDRELALGFLFTEGLIGKAEDVAKMEHPPNRLAPESRYNILDIYLQPQVKWDWSRLDRHFYTSSSCGVCGKASIELVHTQSVYLLSSGMPVIEGAVIAELQDALRGEQSLFARTGGVHAAGLFSADGSLWAVREDVGRHNAVDKLVGAALLRGMIPLRDKQIVVSGRAGFELVQKALMAGVPVMSAVGAPSSLAVDLARDSGMTLTGFVRPDRYNIYSGGERIREAEQF